MSTGINPCAFSLTPCTQICSKTVHYASIGKWNGVERYVISTSTMLERWVGEATRNKQKKDIALCNVLLFATQNEPTIGDS